MTTIIILSVFAVLAFLLQSFLGFKQIKHLGNEYTKMRREGRVAIGRKPGKIASGTIVMFSLDGEGNIRYGRLLQGTTIVARFKDFDKLNNYNIEDITLETPEIKKEIKITRKAIMDAVNNYLLVVNGQEIPEKEAPLNRIFNKAKNIVQGVF